MAETEQIIAQLFNLLAKGLAQGLYGLGVLIRPGIMLAVAARLDIALEQQLLCKMRPSLSNAIKKRLFDRKVDLAYALCVIDADVYSDLKMIKEVRNLLAHPKHPLKEVLTDPELIETIKKFRDYDGSVPATIFYFRKIAECIMTTSKDRDDLEMAQKYLEGSRKQAAKLQAEPRSN